MDTSASLTRWCGLQLEDPALYTTEEGATQVRTLGQELETARQELEGAIGQWELATRAVEAAE